MGERFPYLVLQGDKERAESYLRRARAELYRTKELADRMGVEDYQRLVKLDEDSYIITKVVRGGIEIVNIYAPPFLPSQPIPSEEEDISLIESNIYSIYSGFVYKGWMPEILDPEDNPTFPYLTEFNPTEWCRATNQGDFDPNLSYQNVPRLRVEKSSDIAPQRFNWYGHYLTFPPGNAKYSQYNSTRPCAYTGLMAKAVTAILGYGNFNVNDPVEYDALINDYLDADYITNTKQTGFQVQYDNRFTRSHHITKSSKGKYWLVECSITNGVIAMPLKYLNKSLFNTNPNKDWPVSEVIRELGGLPSGEPFPETRQEILDLIADKVIIELMHPQHYNDAVGEHATDPDKGWKEYAETNCWAMNEEGTEGRVTAFRYKDGDVNYREGGYFQIIINIGTKSGSANIIQLHDPKWMIQGFKADITYQFPPTVPPELESTSFYGKGAAVNDNGVSFYHQDTDSFGGLSITTTKEKWDEVYNDVPNETECVCWVGYINGSWEEVKFHTWKLNDLEDTYYDDPVPRKDYPPGYEQYNVGILTPKTGRGAVGLKFWNPNELDMVRYAHVFSTSRPSYSKQQYIKTWKELRWNSIDSVSLSGSDTYLYNASALNMVGFTQFLINIPGPPYEDDPTTSNFDTALTQMHYYEFTYSAFWILEFPDIETRVTIPPHNRSAYFFTEWEYMPRSYGPSAQVSGNGGDWAYGSPHRGTNPDGQFGAYYTLHHTITWSATFKTARWIDGHAGRTVREEAPSGVSGKIPFPGYTLTPSAMPYRNNKHAFSPPFTMFPADYMNHDQNSYWGDMPVDWDHYISNGQARILVQETGNGWPAEFLTWHNNIIHSPGHPNDVETGELGQCEDWHLRANHFTHFNGTVLFNGWNTYKMWADGTPKGYLGKRDTPSQTFGNMTYYWQDLGASASGQVAAQCEEVSGKVPEGGTPISLPVPYSELFRNSIDLDYKSDAYHWNVLVSNNYNEWQPYIKTEAFLVCDTFGLIPFQDKYIKGTDTPDWRSEIPPGFSAGDAVPTYNWASDPENRLDDSDITDEKTHKSLYHVFCQHAVMGKPAILYSNLDTVNTKGLGTYDIIAKGIHPALPDTEGDDEYMKFTTFIGVNSE